MTQAVDGQALTVVDWILLVGICSPIVGLLVWGVFRLRQAQAAVRAALRQSGAQDVHLEHRVVRTGPFVRRTQSHVIFRVRVRDDRGREQRGWACWGRTWLFSADTLDVRWDE